MEGDNYRNVMECNKKVWKDGLKGKMVKGDIGVKRYFL